MHAHGSLNPMPLHPTSEPACFLPWAPATPEPTPPSKDRQSQAICTIQSHTARGSLQNPASAKIACRTAVLLTFLLPAAPQLASLHEEGPTGWSSHRPEATQLCPTQVSGPQSTDIALSSRAPSAPCTEPGAKPSTSLQTPQPPHLLLCRRASLPGPCASCQLCFRQPAAPQASAGPGRKRAPAAYSLGRLPSVSLVTGEPAGLQVGSQVLCHRHWVGSVPACHPPAGGGQPPPPCGPHPAVPPRYTHPCRCLRLGTCTSGLWPSWWEGPGDTDTDTMPSPSPRPGAAAQGAGSGI